VHSNQVNETEVFVGDHERANLPILELHRTEFMQMKEDNQMLAMTTQLRLRLRKSR